MARTTQQKKPSQADKKALMRILELKKEKRKLDKEIKDLQTQVETRFADEVAAAAGQELYLPLDPGVEVKLTAKANPPRLSDQDGKALKPEQRSRIVDALRGHNFDLHIKEDVDVKGVLDDDDAREMLGLLDPPVAVEQTSRIDVSNA